MAGARAVAKCARITPQRRAARERAAQLDLAEGE
jgi:hypothetical protein